MMQTGVHLQLLRTRDAGGRSSGSTVEEKLCVWARR